MDQERMERWIAWLLKNQDKQGTGQLCAAGPPRKYCCLGGLAEVEGKLEGLLDVTKVPAVLPADLACEWGFVILDDERTQKHFIKLNDSLSWTFAQIAEEVRRVFGTKKEDG